MMKFIDLESQYKKLKDKIDSRINTVLQHGHFINGPEVEELESRLAHYVGVKHCIAVSSGTDGLLVALMALGIGVGDEVITTPFTFMATGEVILLLGAKPIFVDIDYRTFNLDPNLIEAKITPRTKAIIAVSLYGQCADFDKINRIASLHNLPVIEDAAQSFGSVYKGRNSCGLSTIGVASFFPSKPLGCYGDGGACFTNSDELRTKMSQIRVHGQEKRYYHTRLGLNARLDTLQAAILLGKFDNFISYELAQRSKLANHYIELLNNVNSYLNKQVILPPFIESFNHSVFGQFTILVESRHDLVKHLDKIGIPTCIHYPIPLPSQPVFAGMEVPKNDYINAVYASEHVLSLPFHPYMQENMQHEVIGGLIEFYERIS